MSPHDFSIIGEVAITTAAEVAQAVDAARTALPLWRALSISDRCEFLKRFASLLEEAKDQLATLAAKEMGMPITQSKTDVMDALEYLSWYILNSSKYLAAEITFENSDEMHVVFSEPYGVVAVIAPWNYPVTNFVWGTMQALIAGNTIVFKHSEEVPLCGKFIQDLLTKAGLPVGVFNEIYGRGPVGATLSRQDVDLIIFTGGTETGESLYRTAAAGGKKLLMELGGSAPGIVFDDADYSAAVGGIFAARFSNSGQMCDALKRLLVHEAAWDRLMPTLLSRLEMVKVGNPLNSDTTMGPLVSRQQLQRLEVQVSDALSKGALVLAGAKRPGLDGAYYMPTVLTNITPDMLVWSEEVFGPVLPVVKFKTEDEAVALANNTEFGLGSYIFTKDLARAQRVARRLQTGMVSVNAVSYVKPMNPFGGYKRSGIGREHGRWGFEEVTQKKVISIPKR